MIFISPYNPIRASCSLDRFAAFTGLAQTALCLFPPNIASITPLKEDTISASGSVYLIKSDKGYWLPGGFGYTSNKAEAGRFSVADMASLNLDGCTLSLFREDKPFGPGKFLGD